MAPYHPNIHHLRFACENDVNRGEQGSAARVSAQQEDFQCTYERARGPKPLRAIQGRPSVHLSRADRGGRARRSRVLPFHDFNIASILQT